MPAPNYHNEQLIANLLRDCFLKTHMYIRELRSLTERIFFMTVLNFQISKLGYVVCFILFFYGFFLREYPTQHYF